MATLYDNFGVTESTATLNDNLLTGDLKRVEVPIIIVSGQAALTRGTVMGKVTASGKYAVYSDAASNGTEVAAGILALDTDAASGGDVAAFMYVTGEFNSAACAGYDAAAAVDLKPLNIYFHPVAV